MDNGGSTERLQESDVGAYASDMDFLVLGPVEVYQDGKALPVGGSKQRSILALLVANVRQPVSLERIVDSVYGEDAAGGARHSVQTFISTIRRNLGDIIRKDGGGYVLDVDATSIDAVRFEERVRAALTVLEDDPDAAAESLREALAMWRGHPYADVDGRALFGPEITRLDELRLSALEGRIDADLAAGRHRESVGELEALTVEHPLRERFRAQQMLALYRCGRQTEALRAYERTRAYLGDEIGIDPSPALRHLEQRILDQDPALDLPAAPSVAQKAVMVVEVADTISLSRLDPAERTSLVQGVAATVTAALRRHNGEGFEQRGSALYAAFASVGDALAAVGEAVVTSGSEGWIRPRFAVDFGDVEVHEAGEVTGPPVRRGAGMVAAAHPGQVLLSAEAHEALTAGGESGWMVRSLGTHAISGIDAPQQVFQLVIEGQEAEFAPLLCDAMPPPLPMDRRAIVGYEMRRPISSDLSGTTYRAYQPSVGREVVVTVIDPAWANEPDFVRRFEVETQLVTRLQHPHIVPVLDYWRDPTGAYLVTPSVGASLVSASLHVSDLDEGQRFRLIQQVGEALAYAHTLGVVHGAVSLDAVTLDESGNAYLSGTSFVLRLAGVPRAPSAMSAAESVRDEPVTSATDVHGLGLLASQVLGGESRVGGGSVPMTSPPSDLADLIDRATTDRPEERIASVDDFLAELSGVLGRQDSVVAFTAARNPYKGLEAFAEADADDFFGRSDSVQDLASMVAKHRFVAVVGPSGSGKSSLVKAGLVPVVRSGGVDGSEHWAVTSMYPGAYPFEELESALAKVAIEDPKSVMDELDRDERGLVRVIKRILPADTRMLLIIDQFEEVFTLTRDDTTRDRFLQALVALAADERSDTRVVITLRADFFDRPLQHPEFGELFKRGMFALTTPGADELGEAVRRPAEAVGVDWEAGLVGQIVTDVSDEPGTLPLLQYALTEVFATRSTDRLTHDDYRATGGVLGALGSRAEAVYHQLDVGDQDLARQLFLRLVTVQPSGEQTRRRARMVELNAISDPGDVDTVLSAFGNARLLTFDRDPVTRGPTVEVAHEALLTRWPRLTDWIAEAREDLLLHQRLADAVDEWGAHDRDEGYLLAGGRLAQFAAWAGVTNLTLTEDETEYLELSQKRSEEQRTRRRRTRNLVTAGFAAAALVGLVLATVAFLSRQEATANAGLARSRELAASAINVLDEDPELSLLLALEGASTSDPTIESVSAVHEALANHRKIFTYVWPEDEELQDLSTQLTPDGRRMVASGGRNYIEVVEVDTGEKLWGHRFPGNGIVRATFTPDGSEVVATYGWSSADGGAAPDPETEAQLGVHLIDTETGDLNRQLDTGACGIVARPESMQVADVGSEVAMIAAIGQDPDCTYRGARGEDVVPPPVSWLDLTTGDSQQISVPESAAHVTPDGRLLLVAGEGETLDGELSSRLIEQASGREIASFSGWPAGISADGTVVMTISADHLRTWILDSDADVTAGATFEGFLSFSANAEQANLSADGSRVAATVEGVQMWDARTGDVLGPFLTGLGSNHMLSFSTDSSRVLVGESFGGSAVVLDLAAPREIASQKLCSEFTQLTGTVHVENDTTVVDASCDGNGSLSTRFVIDSNSHTVRTSIPHQGAARSALSPDGRLVAVQLGELAATVGEIVLRDTANGDVVSTMDGLCEWEDGGEWGPDCVAFPGTPFPDWPWSFAFSPGGSLLAMAGQNTDAVVVWDTRTGQIVATPTVEHNTDGPSQVLSVAFSPDGERLAASFVWSPKELWLLSTDDWTAITQYEIPADAETIEAPSDNLVYTPDGETLIATDFLSFGEGRIVFMDGSTLELLDEIPDAHGEGVAQIALNEEGTMLASAGLDGLVKVWDVENRTLVQQIPVSSDGTAVGGVAFTGDGTHLSVTSGTNGELHRVTIDPDELLGIARVRLTRTFTETECTTYRIDPCPTLVDVKAG